MPTLKEVIAVIEELAPPALAADWDNSGLQLGDPSADVTGVLVALDPSADVIAEAKNASCNLLVAHHPLFFRPVKSFDLSHGQGLILREAVKSGIAVYSAHTSLDRAPGGVNDALAAPLGLKDAKPLQKVQGWPEGYGFGVVGELPDAMTVRELAEKLKTLLGVASVKLVGDPDRLVRRLSLCGGSGSDLLGAAVSAGADAYITKPFSPQRLLSDLDGFLRD